MYRLNSSKAFVIKYLYQCALRFQYKIKQIENKIHKSNGRVYWLMENNELVFIKPKDRKESDRYFK